MNFVPLALRTEQMSEAKVGGAFSQGVRNLLHKFIFYLNYLNLQNICVV